MASKTPRLAPSLRGPPDLPPLPFHLLPFTGLCPAWNNRPPCAVRGHFTQREGWPSPAATGRPPPGPRPGRSRLPLKLAPRPACSPSAARTRSGTQRPDSSWQVRAEGQDAAQPPAPQSIQGHREPGQGAPGSHKAPLLLTGILGCGVNRDVCKGDRRNETDVSGHQQPASDRLTVGERSLGGSFKDDSQQNHTFLLKPLPST